MLRRVAREHKSQALEADAMHFTTDIWSSAVVLAGLTCVGLASFAEPDSLLYHALTKADAVAALGVAGIVLMVSWNMARNAVLTLMDGGMSEQARLVRAALAANAPAYAARSVRVRGKRRAALRGTCGCPCLPICAWTWRMKFPPCWKTWCAECCPMPKPRFTWSRKRKTIAISTPRRIVWRRCTAS